MRLGLALFALVLFTACGDSGNPPVPDKPKPILDLGPAADLPLTEMGAPLEGGADEDSGPVVDGVKPADGVIPADGPVTSDGPQPLDGPQAFDGPGTDAPQVLDGPTTTGDGPKTDTPQQLDGPTGDIPQVLDGPKTEGTSSGDAPQVLDQKLFDGSLVKYDVVAGKNDAGQFLCVTAFGGVVVCQCNDGVDNDADNKIDYPNDPGCTSLGDNSEIDGTTQCTDGVDNDNDGKIDANDPECTGPLDNDESSYGTGIPGDNIDCKSDCFFDGNSGAGDDGCAWNLKCDPLNPAAHLPPPQKNCTYDTKVANDPKQCPSTQSSTCLGFCLPLTPNGCDCFGCCQIPIKTTDGGLSSIAVLLKPTCKVKPDGTIDPWAKDSAGKLLCPHCTQVTDCVNTCGKCEVCVGKPAPDPSCFAKTDAGTYLPTDAGTNPFCCCGYQYCGPGGIDPNSCPAKTYCITGCCVPVE